MHRHAMADNKGRTFHAGQDARLQGLLVALVTCAVYLALPERVYFFDGVSFAGGIEYALENPGNPDVLFRFPKHYLYIPAVYGLARALSWLVPASSIDAYRLMQILAGCLAGALNGVLFVFLRRRITSTVTCLALVAVWAFSNIHWERALEGQTYFAGQFWAILALVAFAWSHGSPSRRATGVMAVCTALAGLFHVANVIVVVPIAVAWIWQDGRRALRPLAIYAATAAGLTVAAPLVHYRFWDPAEVRRWFLASVNDTEFYSSGFFVVPSVQSVWERSILVFAEFLVPLQGGGLALAAGLSLTGLFAATLGIGLWERRRAVRRDAPVRRREALVPLAAAAFATWAIFFSVATPGYLFHWEVAFFGLWLLVVAGHVQRRRLLTACLAVLAVGVPSFNLAQKYWPISRHDHNRDALAAARIGAMIPPSEPLFLLGTGTGDNNLKAYMVHFGGRGWLAADITMRDVPRESRCDAFAGVIRTRLQQRGVAFFSTTLLDRPARARVAGHHGCPDPDALLPLEAMRCLVLDEAPEVGLVLAWSGDAAALGSLQSYYRGAGRGGLADRLAAAGAFGACRDLPALRAPR